MTRDALGSSAGSLAERERRPPFWRTEKRLRQATRTAWSEWDVYLALLYLRSAPAQGPSAISADAMRKSPLSEGSMSSKVREKKMALRWCDRGLLGQRPKKECNRRDSYVRVPVFVWFFCIVLVFVLFFGGSSPRCLAATPVVPPALVRQRRIVFSRRKWYCGPTLGVLRIFWPFPDVLLFLFSQDHRASSGDSEIQGLSAEEPACRDFLNCVVFLWLHYFDPPLECILFLVLFFFRPIKEVVFSQ